MPQTHTAHRLAVAATLLTFAVLPARAGDDAGREDALRHEAAGLKHEARLEAGSAFEAYHAALNAAVTAAAWDEAEVYLRKLDFLAGWADRQESFVAAVSPLGANEAAPPLLRDLARWHESESLHALGRLEEAAAARAGLGLIETFAIVGPFDNERGRGFTTAFGPEQAGAVDLTSRYPGKVREVSWRVDEDAAFLGVVDLNAMLRPNDEALAYALAYVWNEGAPRAAALRLGSDEGLTVFVNDAEVWRRDIYRQRTFDQDAVVVRLATGWNKLLFKVAEKKGAWAFQARLTALDGGALSFRTATADELRGGLAPAEIPAGAPEAPAGEVVARGAIDAYLAQAAREDVTARALFHLGYLQYRRRAHDEGEHPDREAFQRAIVLDPDAAHLHVYLSHALRQTGELSVSREENPRRKALERALALDPDHARAALLLARYYREDLRSPERARTYLDEALRVNPRSYEARLLEIDLLGDRRLAGPVRAALHRLWAVKGLREVGAVRRRVAKVTPRDGTREALLRETLALNPTDAGTRNDLVSVLTRRARPEEAEALLRAAIALHPRRVGPRLELAEHLIGRDALPLAAKELQAASRICPEDDEVLFRLARLEHRQQHTEAALALMNQVLALNPSRVEVRQYVQLLRRERPFEDDYREDAEAAIAAASAIAIDKEVEARVLLDQSVIRVNRNGTAQRFTERVLRIENEQGIRAHQNQRVVYAQGEQQVRFRRATVIKPDGTRQEAALDNPSTAQGAEFTQYRAHFVSLPRLETGDVVWLQYRLDDLRQGFFGDYFGHTHFFAQGQPVQRSRFVLVTPADRTLYFNEVGLSNPATLTTSEDGALAVRTFTEGPLARLETEPLMPPVKERSPHVQVSTFEDWDAFSRWYWNLVKKQHEVSPELKAKVLELTAGKEERADKVRAIYDFVVTDVRYNDKWEFGVHGFKPYNATSIFERRFGDCKDKATLINTMLSVVGIESWPVLIKGENPRSREDLTLPLMNHFNHCIAFVPGDRPGGGEGWFLDGTAQYHPAETLPSMDYGATVLVVRPDGGELRTIGLPTALEENGVVETQRVKLTENGASEVEATIEPRGALAVFARQRLVNPALRQRRLEEIYGRRYPGAEVIEASFSDLEDLAAPVRITVRLKLPGLLEKSAQGYALEEMRSALAPLLLGDKLSNRATQSERKTDVLLPVPAGGEEVCEYTLPEGFRLESLPEAATIKSPFGHYERTYEQRGGVLRVTRRLVITEQRIPAANYDAWRRFAAEVDRAEEARVRLKRGGAAE